MARGRTSKRAAVKAAGKELKKKPWNASWARCGDGCLDKHVIGVCRAPALPLALPLPAAPLVLLGIISGNSARRAMLRCTWLRTPGLQDSVRVLFVVGRNAPASTTNDELRVNVTEGEHMRSHKQTTTATFDPDKKVKTGSVTTYWKLAAFLEFAAKQPEPRIGRADDDVLISPRMLVANARLLLGFRDGKPDLRAAQSWAAGGELPLVFAGVFEWYSWRTGTLHSTGFGYSAGASRKRAHAPWRNCSSDGKYVWRKHADGTKERLETDPRDRCVGPLAFAKGPLMLLSRSAVGALVASPLFARDVGVARQMASGARDAYVGPGSGRIDDDVQLGYWLSQLPRLHVVTFRRYMAWHDRWKAGVTQMLPRLLLAHKVPWAQFGEMMNRTERLWAAAPRLQARAMCEGPPCESCAHVPGQHACALDVEVDAPPAAVTAGTCWPKCVFVKGSAPSVPADCWRKPVPAR